jgi:hypothetical protein
MFAGAGRPASARANDGTANVEAVTNNKAAVKILAFIFLSILNPVNFS